MKIFKKILIVIVVLIVVIVGVSQFLPSHSHVERNLIIQAKPEVVHAWVNDLKKWPEWSAWSTNKDATLVYSYEGPEKGVGAVSKWDGKKTGDGRMTITESDPQKGVKFDLSFMHDEYKSKGALNFAPAGDSTKVTWTFDADISRNPMHRYMSLFMEKFVGPDFEEGLAGLKRKAEAK